MTRSKHVSTKPGRRQPRGEQVTRRASSSRQPRKLVLIVCEGKKTEYFYFEAIRKSEALSNVMIKIEPGAGQAYTLVKNAHHQRNLRAQNRDSLPFDEVWCVMDREGINEPAHFNKAIDFAKKEKLGLAISNPCFEYWYLLHFRETSSYFAHADAVCQALCHEQCMPQYSKNRDVYEQLRSYTESAVERAERCYNRHPDRDHDEFPNPSTLVFLLVRRLLQL